MKHTLLAFCITALMAISAGSMAQSTGEMDRFDASMMTEHVNVVKLFPNPVVDYLQIEIENSTLENPKFTLYNIIGNEINLKVEKKEDNIYEVQVSDLPAGYYLIAIKDEHTFFGETYKFVKR